MLLWKSSIKYSEGVSVYLAVHHAKHMSRIILSSVRCPTVPYISTLPRKRGDFFLKTSIEHKMCFDFLYNFCPGHLSF